jgi:hypothetical protein
VDASNEVHADMRSQTGGMKSLGKGAIYISSIKQKLNIQSSTESEMVGIHDILPKLFGLDIYYKPKV